MELSTTAGWLLYPTSACSACSSTMPKALTCAASGSSVPCLCPRHAAGIHCLCVCATCKSTFLFFTPYACQVVKGLITTSLNWWDLLQAQKLYVTPEITQGIVAFLLVVR